MDTSERPLSQDTVFDILSSPRRRYVLYYLRQTNEPVKLTELAEQVAAWENDIDSDSLSEQQRKRAYVSLYQTHVPKLAEAGVVEYDSDAGTVSLAPGATTIDDYLSQPENGLPWARIYLGEAVFGAILLGLSLSGVSVFGALSSSIVALVIVTAFILTTVAQFIYRRRQRTIPPELKRRQ